MIVCFVDTGGIVNHHCLNFLLVIWDIHVWTNLTDMKDKNKGSTIRFTGSIYEGV